jgi:competence protein ComEA
MLEGLKNYFNIGKWQAWAIIVLCSTVLLLVIVNYSLPLFEKPFQLTTTDSVAIQQLAANIVVDTSTKNNYYTNTESDGSNITAYTFNPNVLDENGFKKLGLSDRTVKTILNYRTKGGHFYSKQDVQKMYTISNAEYVKLEPFIDLPAKSEHQNNFVKKEYKPIIVNLNTCDTATLIKLRGIGPAGAIKTITYRESLGGFYNHNQLLEVYGMADSTINSLKAQLIIDASKIKKININTVLFQDLNMHPYFKNGIALAILKYRKSKNGNINTIDELKNLPEITTPVFEKIRHYVMF